MMRKVAIAFFLAGILGSQSYFGQDKKASSRKNSDVDNVGNRNINKGNINFTSLEKEQQLGRQLSAEVERQVKLLDDPVINEYVNRVGQNLVRNSDAKVPFTIKVVDSDEINAFALPGGYFYVNTGLIAAADDEAELAGVMAHEIAHVAARHATENMAKGTIASIGSIPLVILGGPAGAAARQASQVAIPLEFLKFSRKNEEEADYLGLQYMYKAGYDPSAFVSMFEKLQAKEKSKPGSISKLFDTHPPTADRIEKTKKNIEEILPDREQYAVTSSEFQTIKARLEMLENGQVSRLHSGSPAQRTTRTDTTTDKSDADKTDTGDDRPTLKRKPNKP